MNTATSTHTKSKSDRLVRALDAALAPVDPPAALFDRLQTHVRSLKTTPKIRQLTPALLQKPETPYIGIAGVFMVLMTLALGVRTAGSIIGAFALAAEMNKQLKGRKPSRLTPAG